MPLYTSYNNNKYCSIYGHDNYGYSYCYVYIYPFEIQYGKNLKLISETWLNNILWSQLFLYEHCHLISVATILGVFSKLKHLAD